MRQLEALIRITEAVAKSSLSPVATAEHVAEAVRLFRVSTLNAAASGLSSLDGNLSEEDRKTVRTIEGRVGRLVNVGGSIALARLRQQLVSSGYADELVTTALKIMERRQEVQLFNERKSLRRLR